MTSWTKRLRAWTIFLTPNRTPKHSFAQLEQWNDEDEYTRCIQALNAIPEDWRNYRTAYALAGHWRTTPSSGTMMRAL